MAANVGSVELDHNDVRNQKQVVGCCLFTVLLEFKSLFS